MNEEIDESEFYHQDFTTASEWEVFIARLEEIIHEWKIEDNKSPSSQDNSTFKEQGIWRIKTENIPFADVEFTFTHYSVTTEEIRTKDEEDNDIIQHPLQNSFDFILQDSCNQHEDISLHYWYGLQEYIVLSPANNANIVSESRIKILLSSANIAIGNSNCEIPIFIQIREKWQKYYLGVYESSNIRTNFEMVHLRRGPQHCQYLTGLTDLFKTKILSPVQLEPIVVSVQFSYLLSDFGAHAWKQESVDSEDFDSNSITLLPLGVTVDPVESLVIRTQWSQMADNLIVDSETYTNFEPMQAPKWTLLANFADKPICLLSDCLSEFIHLMMNVSTVYDVLGDFAVQPTQENAMGNALDVLTESKVPTITSVLKRAARNSLTKTQRKIGLAPLNEEVLVPMLYFLFPDAEENTPHAYFTNRNTSEEEASAIEEKFKGFKTCRIDSLVWRLSIVLCHALYSLGGARAVAHVWFEFVQEMRYRWEKSILIPGLSPGFPDARTCLLHQKLQMLNCCIERKKSRESLVIDREFQSFDEGNSSEEEFFDADDEQLSEEQKSRQRYLPWNQPVGRLGKYESMKLIKTGNQLYIPMTQEPVPKTEDQLEEYTDILLKLGSDAQGSELRARMMSASLLSDMESFKAANPGSILEDFIRWYSPRDWIQAEGVDEWGQANGHLSSRMLIANNTWVETWTSAKAVPANRQRRLFDDTREAEKVLHFLDSRNLSQIAELLLPVLSHAALVRVEDECRLLNVNIRNSGETLQHLTRTIERLSREGKTHTRRYEMLVQELIPLELALAEAHSLLYKLIPVGAEGDAELSGMVAELIGSKEVVVVGKELSKAGARIIAMFGEAQKAASLVGGDANIEGLQAGGGGGGGGGSAFPQPHVREFVMRVSANRPAVYSAKCVQFLRALLAKNEFRLCGAFSEDITFF